MQFNEEQKNKLRALRKSSFRNSAKISMKMFALLLPANAIIVAMDVLWIHSQTFSFVGSMMNAFFICSMTGREMRQERDRVREEVKKIFDTK